MISLKRRDILITHTEQRYFHPSQNGDSESGVVLKLMGAKEKRQ